MFNIFYVTVLRMVPKSTGDELLWIQRSNSSIFHLFQQYNTQILLDVTAVHGLPVQYSVVADSDSIYKCLR